MQRRWKILASLSMTLLLAVGCASAPPAAVVDALEHQLQDLPLIESELLPLVPADAELEYVAIDGTTKRKNARELWQERTRALMFRQAGLVAWSRGEQYDPQTAFAKLFPEKPTR